MLQLLPTHSESVLNASFCSSGDEPQVYGQTSSQEHLASQLIKIFWMLFPDIYITLELPLKAF